MEIQITKEDQELLKLWPITSFYKAYDNKDGIKKLIVTSLSSDDGSPDKIAILVFRLFIEKGVRLGKGQKYVLGLRFYNFGDFATLDLISLDKDYHKNIASEHIKRMNWPSIEDGLDDFKKTIHSPFLFSGAFVELKDEKLIFSSTSQDYGNSVFLANSNEISFYLSSLCGLSVFNKSEETEGKNFLYKILQFMLETKIEKDFYEKFVALVLRSQDKTQGFSAQQIASLFTMKVIDRSIRENKGLLKIMVDEMSGGFSRNIMLQSIAKRLS